MMANPRVLLGAALVLLWGGAVLAQFPEPRLTSLSSPGGRAGESVTLTVAGVDLEEPALRFSHPEITAVRDEKDPKKFTVTVAAGVPAGLHDVRVLGIHGVTNPRRFEVGKLPEVEASVKAVTRAEAQELQPPCVVGGAAIKQQTSWFKVPVVAGRVLRIECHAAELDSRMDPLLVLADSAGHELVRTRGRSLEWTAKADQPLFVAVRDFIGNGGVEHFYRLHVGGPSDLPLVAAESPLVLWKGAGDVVKEGEPNDLEHAARLTAPFEVEGRFFPARDVDAFRFEAKKGEAWWVECVSNRLGQPTLPRVVIERSSQTKEGGEEFADAVEIKPAPWFPGDPDFDGQHFDPVGLFEPKADGSYRIAIRDLHHHGDADSGRRYVLSVRKAAPDFALVCAPLPPVVNKAFKTFTGPAVAVRGVNLRPGQVLPLRVMAVRRDGFQGEIRLRAEGLPAGVTAEECLIGARQSEGTLLLRAVADAAPWCGAVRVHGEGRIGETDVRHEAHPSTPLWESTGSEFVEPARSRFCAETAVAVVADANFPVVLKARTTEVEATVADKVRIGLKLERSGEGGAAVKVKPQGFDGLDKAKEFEVPVSAEGGEYELDLAPLKLGPGSYTVWFRGEEKVKREVKGKPADVPLVLCSNPVVLRLKEAAKK